ncbi:acyl-CoA dehydrogenase family protein [Nocardia nova]|uniref:acyl-CoA dehydrogenase family protein n=1 Tax=Nocardia nova TaxID=37330 RepID=UPI0033E29AE8
MEIQLSDEQAMLQEMTRSFLAKESPLESVRALVDDAVGFDPALWRRGAELGWGAMVVPEQYGGAGSDEAVRDVAVIAEEFGRLLQPGPLVSNTVVAFAVSNFGTDDQRREVLPGLVSGDQTAAWCLAEGDRGWDPHRFVPSVEVRGSGYTLSGTKDFVPDAHAAQNLLVTALAPTGPIQFLLPARAPGITVVPLRGLDLTRRLCRVRFDAVEVAPGAVLGTDTGSAGEHWQRQFELALVMHCAETVGAMDRIFEITLEYANERFAFGRPIGSFQSIKHMFADMYGWLESAKAISCAATDAVQARRADVEEVVNIAKAYIGEYAPRLVQQCLQIHGGIGYTWEHDLHFYLRRAKSNEILYGSPEWHRDRICELAGLPARDRQHRPGTPSDMPHGQTGDDVDG